MSQDTTPQPDLTSQFRELGDNLKNILQTAWQSDEAQKLRQDIKDGLSELGRAANDAINEFNASEAGHRIKEEAQEFKSRVESGEVEARAREEISQILQTINAELTKAIDQLSKSDEEPVE
jgi:hypothetical protein